MFRTNLILAIVAVVLAIPTAYTLYQDRTIFTDYEEIPRLFAGFTRDNVRGVVVSKPRRDDKGALVRDDKGEVVRDALQLLRSDPDWVIAGQGPLAGVPVRAARVYERVLQHFESIKRDERALVREAAMPNELGRYGLGADEATLVQCYDATAPIAELYVGNDASRGQAGEDVVHGFFVRSKDSSDVVLYEQNYWVLDLDPAQWYDRNPLTFPVDEAVEVAIHNPRGDAVFGRKDAHAPDWEKRSGPEDVGAVRNSEVRAFVQSIAMLDIQTYAQRLPAAGPQQQALLAEHGLATPTLWAEVALASGARHRVAVGEAVAGKNERFLTISSVDYLMTVGEWIMARFEKDPAAVFFDPPAGRATGETGR